MDKTWDYVALGDSYPAGYGAVSSYVDYYAEHIEEDLGVQVELHNYAQTGLTSSELLSQVRSDKELREALRNAEVITIWIGWNDFRESLAQFYVGTCGGEKNLDCMLESVTMLNGNIDAILDEILNLANPQDTLIRIADTGIPPIFLITWKQHGWFETLQESCFEVWRDHLVAAANQRDIRVVYTYQILNGPGGDERMKGIYQSDGIHFNDRGQRLIADLHREAGYEYSPGAPRHSVDGRCGGRYFKINNFFVGVICGKAKTGPA
ncbi:MAG: SGNH/GDSL hydrolase family protein [Anaerolineales bacterium]|nr:SGNH/GDSL hydrolase family protein [Anaerolineales bacterium]